MNNPPVKDFFASPALSLSLAGVFRNNAAAVSQVEEGDEGSGGGCQGEQAGTSGENSEPAGQSDEDRESNESLNGGREVGNKKKRKKYHRHTVEQIRVMEALFKESPHPDEKQRQQLSKQLGLSARQVKFWFQNRRTQIKAVQERHENSLLKSEIEKLQEENRTMRETIKKASCPHCGFTTLSKDTTMTTEEQQLRIENARLKAEIEKLRRIQGSIPDGNTSPSSSCSAGGDQNKSSLDSYSGFMGLDKSRILDIANVAMDELIKMATAQEPLWVRSVETGREILNYDEYIKHFSPDISRNGSVKNIEASRENGVIFFDTPRLVQAFMDVNQWKELFPCLISKATIFDVISNGQGESKDGTIQLMFAEIQMLTPLVPIREIYFVRYCKKISPSKWAILDVSIDKLEENIDSSFMKCRKRPSGCIIEDQDNGHCKVVWVEHIECQKCVIPTLYRSIVTSGLAFGARHWMATLRLQCERSVFYMATNVPTRDCNGVSTLAGRKSILRLGQRMTSNFCQSIGASGQRTWTKVSTKGGDDIRFTTRKNINDPGEPQGLIVCAVLSSWMPVPTEALFDFLRDDSRRTEWDIMLTPGATQTIVNLAKGQDRGNSVTVHKTTSSERTNIWVLQDSSTNSYESMVVFAPVDIEGMQSVMTGCDSSSLAILPSGFSILPDGLETRPLVITSRPDERTMEGGSLLTIAFQILANSSHLAKLTMESVETVNAIVSCTLRNIKKALQCEDG
ncbi:homeobox-leucine zipper protein GLABRA 2 [Canna indica]|uniref:Homeobox-leucine zipper protein GLABRA 2 n=1 Tax=Canna indica TaxID=4628 RepID=A0AAQ3QK40_9LILI|nr:homeobox-leucine zipper protein GLABRA 2 [Canna indica]